MLKPRRKVVRFIQILLASEYLLVEFPITIMTLIAVHNLTNAPLLRATTQFIAVGAVILPVVCIIVPAIYLYLACRESNTPLAKASLNGAEMFRPNANRETKDLLICLFGGSFMVFAFQGANIATWYTREFVLHARITLS